MNKGITLIALIITIIAMLILISVSVNMIVGDSSIISRADRARYQNSITQIEQKLNEVYTENYEKVESKNLGDLTKDAPVTKARALSYYLEDILGEDNNIFRKAKNSNGYTTNHEFKDESNAKGDKYAYVSSEGYIFYFLSPEKLKSFDSNLEILDLDEPDDRKTSNDLDNLYAVTSDLRVFVIENDIDSLIGIKRDDLSYYDFNSVIYKAGSNWANIFEKEEDITYQEGQVKKNFTMDFQSTHVSEDFDFSGIGELKHLTNLSIKNCSLKNIKGIKESAETLKYLYIENSNITSFEGLESLTNLEQLFLCNLTNAQFNAIIAQLAKGEFPKLNTIALGVAGVWGNDAYNNVTYESYYATTSDDNGDAITSIECFASLKDVTKKAVKNIYLIGYDIGSLSYLSGFNNLEGIRADGNKIQSLEGLGSKPNLATIKVCNNSLTSLDGLSGNTGLAFLDVRKNPNLANISSVNSTNAPELTELWFRSASLTRNDSDTAINVDDVKKNKAYLIGLGGGLLIDAKYSQYLVDNSTTTNLSLIGKIDVDVFDDYKNCKKLEKLSINGITLTKDGKDLQNSEVNKKINDLLSNKNLNSIKYLQIINMKDKVSTAEFFSKMTNLLEVDFRQNSANNIEGLINSPLEHLTIDNPKITLSTENMQKIISKLTNTSTKVFAYGIGLNLCDPSLYEQLSSCTALTKLVLYRDWQFQVGATGIIDDKPMFIDLTGCTNLSEIDIFNVYASFKLPSSMKNVGYGYVYSNKSLKTYDVNSKQSVTDSSKCINDIKLDLSEATSLEKLRFTQKVEVSILEKTLASISPNATNFNYLSFYSQTSGPSSFSGILDKFSNYPNLKTISYSAQYTSPLTDLEGINKIKSLTTLKLNLADKLTTLSDMSDLENLTELTINNPVKDYNGASGLVEVPDVGLRKLKKLQKINLANNSLVNIYGLIPQENDDFPALTELNLEYNSLENQFINGANSYNIENSILVPLHQRKLTTLKLQGNNFKGFSTIPTLKWKEHSGF